MVLGFGSKSKKKGIPQEDRSVRLSPSLPELSAQGVAWPENLVDIAAIRDLPPPPETPEPSAQGTIKSLFRSPSRTGNVPYHRPFRVSADTNASVATNGTISNRNGGPIHALYTSHPPPSFPMNGVPPSATSTLNAKRSMHRKAPPMFNLMVAGGKRTGKTSLLKLIVDTADISPLTSAEQRAAIDRFMSLDGPTRGIESLFVEICESSFDRILLSVIDTPGLDFQEGHELKLDRQVTSIVKYIDLQYADTMDEESKVIRRSKGDQHVHLCLYLIDPASFRSAIIPPPRLSSLPHTSSQSTLTPPHRTRDATPDSDSSLDLMMSPADIRVIRRLSTRVNVLPIIARADTLTDEKLTAIKIAMRRDLHEAGLGFGVFAPPAIKKNGAASDEERSSHTKANGHTSVRVLFPDLPKTNGARDESPPPSPNRSRNVIRLRTAQQPQTRNRSSSRSRTRLSLAELHAADDDEPLPPDAADPNSIATVRFSARNQTAPLDEILPFALVMPERVNSKTSPSSSRRPLKSSIEPPQQIAESESVDSSSTAGTTRTGDTTVESIESMTTVNTMTPLIIARPSTSDGITSSPATSQKAPFYSRGQPRDLKGVFVRRFRWGTVDVLDPAHCDFAAMRTAILSTHLKVLKKNTKEVLYEQYRTEKLLARRATRNISEEDRKRLLGGKELSVL